MLRHFSGSGVTSLAAFSPSPGYKWRLVYAILRIVTSATAGTRQAEIDLVGLESLSFGVVLTGSFSTVSSSITSVVSPSSTGTSYLYTSLDLDTNCSLRGAFNLIAGDTVTYDILVSEEVDM